MLEKVNESKKVDQRVDHYQVATGTRNLYMQLTRMHLAGAPECPHRSYSPTGWTTYIIWFCLHVALQV